MKFGIFYLFIWFIRFFVVTLDEKMEFFIYSFGS